MDDNQLSLALYRGYTHGELAMLQTSQVARLVGDWCRENLADAEFIPKGWKWDPVRGIRVYNPYPKWAITKMFCTYDKALQHLFIPIGFCDDLKRALESWGCEVRELKLNDYPLRKMDDHIKIKDKFTDRPHQVELIKQLSDGVRGMKGVELNMGLGKTYSATRAAINLGYATCIIAPNSLPGQWFKELFDKTTATRNDIYKIEGFDSLAKLARCPVFKPSIFVCSVRTMQMFCKGEGNYKVLPWTYTEFFKEYGIGTKILDEIHLNFHANTIMDLRSNVPFNLYCSATFSQTSVRAREIFMKVFPDSMRCGTKTFTKYTTTYMYTFYGEIMENKCLSSKGYNHSKYENEMLKVRARFNSHMNQMIVPLVNCHYVRRRQPGDKLLIICATIDYVHAVAERLEKEYPDLKIQSFLGGDNNGIKPDSDIIVSTTGKSGTGLDIKGLTTLINTVSMQSETLIPQVFGRLRQIPGREVVYVDMYDSNISAHCRHAAERIDILRKRSLKYHEFRPTDGIYPMVCI